MNQQEIDILKDKYALGTLSDAEHASLEVELLQNPSLAKELEIKVDLVKGIQYAGELELRTLLDKIHYQQPTVDAVKKGGRKIWYLIAGLVLLIGIASFFLLVNDSREEVNSQNVFAAYYKQYTPSLQDRGTSQTESIASFNKSYLRKEYQKALTTIKPYLSQSKNDIKLMAAISGIETNDLALAENLLDEIIVSKDYYFEDHARWYKALVNIKLKKTSLAKDILAPIINNPKADHHDEAKELLAKLNR